MITLTQVEYLVSEFKIDSFTIWREYAQLLFLNQLYQHILSQNVFFKGGTAVHLLFNSPRFSEDLDFSTEYERQTLVTMVKNIEKSLRQEVDNIEIVPLHEGRKSIRFRIKFQVVNLKYPMVIRLDFIAEEKVLLPQSSPLVTKFPVTIFPVIMHLSTEEILAEKIRALMTRGKGRDIYDVWFLLQRGVELKIDLVNSKLATVGLKFDLSQLRRMIKGFPQKQLAVDLNPFLPESHRQVVPQLLSRLIQSLNKNYE